MLARGSRWAAAVTAVVAMGGCGWGGDDPGAQAPVSTSSSRDGAAAASPRDTDAVEVGAVEGAGQVGCGVARPAGAGEVDPASLPATDDGACAFVAVWFDLLDLGYRTGDRAAVEAASEPDCTACADLMSRHADVTGDGSRAQEQMFRISRLYADSSESGVVTVSFDYEVVAVPFAAGPKTGQSVEPVPRRPLRAVVVHGEDGWRMGEMGL